MVLLGESYAKAMQKLYKNHVAMCMKIIVTFRDDIFQVLVELTGN